MAPVAAPAPAPSSAPMRPGLAMRITRSPLVPHSADAVDTRRTGVEARATGAALVRCTAGVTAYPGAGGVMCASVVGATGVVAVASCAVAAAGGRIIHAVVRPVPSAVVPISARPIVASFHGLPCMAAFLLSARETARGAPLFGLVRVTKRAMRRVILVLGLLALVVAVRRPVDADGIMLVQAGSFWMGRD